MIRLTALALAAPLALAALALSAPAFAQSAADGRALFGYEGQNPPTGLCWSCHGYGGKGDGPAGMALTPPPRDFTVGDFKFDADGNGKPGEDADIKLVIENGAGKYGGNPSMAPWGHLSGEQVRGLVAFIRSLKK